MLRHFDNYFFELYHNNIFVSRQLKILHTIDKWMKNYWENDFKGNDKLTNQLLTMVNKIFENVSKSDNYNKNDHDKHATLIIETTTKIKNNVVKFICNAVGDNDNSTIDDNNNMSDHAKHRRLLQQKYNELANHTVSFNPRNDQKTNNHDDNERDYNFMGDIDDMNQISYQQLGEQLTILEYTLFQKIEAREFVHWHSFTKQNQNNCNIGNGVDDNNNNNEQKSIDHEQESTNVKAIIQHFNDVYKMFKLQILNDITAVESENNNNKNEMNDKELLKKLIRRIKYIINVGATLFNLNNIHGCMAIYGMFRFEPLNVYKEPQILSKLSKREEDYLNKFDHTFTYAYGYKNFRIHNRKIVGNCIPYIGRLIKDIGGIQEQPNTFKEFEKNQNINKPKLLNKKVRNNEKNYHVTTSASVSAVLDENKNETNTHVNTLDAEVDDSANGKNGNNQEKKNDNNVLRVNARKMIKLFNCINTQINQNQKTNVYDNLCEMKDKNIIKSILNQFSKNRDITDEMIEQRFESNSLMAELKLSNQKTK